MKKYLIINDDGAKKTIYAKDLMQALKLSDAINIIPGMFITLKADPLHSVYRVKEINRGEYGVVLVRYSMWDGQLVERDAGGNYSFDSLKKNVTNIFNTYDEAKKYLLHHDAVRTATSRAPYITGLKSLRKKNDSVDADTEEMDSKKTIDALVNKFKNTKVDRVIWDDCTPTKDRRPTTETDVREDIHVRDNLTLDTCFDVLGEDLGEIAEMLIDDGEDPKTITVKDLLNAIINYHSDPGDGSSNIIFLKYKGKVLVDDLKSYTNDTTLDGNTCSEDDVINAILSNDEFEFEPDDSVDATVIDKPIDTVDEAYNPEYSIQQFKSYVSNIMKDLYGNEYNVDTVRAISKLDTYVSQVIDDFKTDIKNSNLDKRKTVQYYTQYVDALYKELADVKNAKNINGQNLIKIDDIYEKMTRSIHDSKFKDEANLPTTLQALINDEEAAIKAYEVAIKNLEDKIDENQMQVLINIMKDERRHVENLYAVLNGQVTEKNLEDSIKDAAPGVDKKKFDRLVNYFNAWGKPSRNELQEVIDYYRLNSATAYQLLYYWGYKNEFEKLHFYDSANS